MSSVSAHIAQTLARHVDQVFGLMGNGNAYFLDTLCEHTSASYTAVRHEAGGVAAADAYYRASGKLAAATATYGAGFTNALTPLAESAQARIPLVLIAGDEPSSGPRAWDVDQVALAAALNVKTFTVGLRDAAVKTLQAMEHALAFRTPVVLAIPYDLSAAEAGEIPELGELKLPAPVAPTGYGIERINQAARALADAQRPVIIAGRGAWVSGAGQELGELAAATGALTSSTALARSIFPDASYDLGVTGGFGAEEAMGLIRQADVVLVVGAALNQFTMRFGDLFAAGTRVIQVDVAPAATHPHVAEYIRGDAKGVVSQMVRQLNELDTTPSGWRESVDVDAARRYEPAEAEYAADGRLDPRAVAAKLGELLPQDRIVVSDGGHFIGWANMYWPVAAPDRMLMVGTAYQTIGLGIHSIAGAAAAKPDSTVVLTAGDGGSLMAMADLETAVRVAAGRGLAVIWNDAAYAAEVNLYGLKGLAEEPMLINETSFAALAEAVGAEGIVVQSLADLDRVAQWAKQPQDERKFLMLDCRISPHVIAPYQLEVIKINS